MLSDDQVQTEEQPLDESQDLSASTPAWTNDPWSELVKSMQEAIENLGPAVEDWGETTQV
jgi:hypothetical protein